MRRRDPAPFGGLPARPLCVLLLPRRLERFALRDKAQDLLRAPGVVAVEPPALSYAAFGRLPELLADRIAAAQARRLDLPGVPRAVVVFHPLQYPLARALVSRHPGAELWYGRWEGDEEERPRLRRRLRALHEAAAQRSALAFAASEAENRPLWERMEALGIESGRLGSDRRPP